METWRNITIENYERYEVSDLGRVRNCRGDILYQEKIKKGYYRVKLSYKGREKNFKVHRLVALAFIDNPNNYDQVNHLDCIKTNNSVSNLEWTNNKNNMIHAYRNNLSHNFRIRGRFAKRPVN